MATIHYTCVCIGITLLLAVSRSQVVEQQSVQPPVVGLSGLFLLDCGRISCDITYQYCNPGLLGTRPVCSLCADICGPGRVGTDRIFIQHCLQACPVYWYRQQLDTIARSVTDATTVPTVSESRGLAMSAPLAVILALVVMCTVLLASVLTLVLYRKTTRSAYHAGRPYRDGTPTIKAASSRSLPSDSGYQPDPRDSLLEGGSLTHSLVRDWQIPAANIGRAPKPSAKDGSLPAPTTSNYCIEMTPLLKNKLSAQGSDQPLEERLSTTQPTQTSGSVPQDQTGPGMSEEQRLVREPRPGQGVITPVPGSGEGSRSPGKDPASAPDHTADEQTHVKHLPDQDMTSQRISADAGMTSQKLVTSVGSGTFYKTCSLDNFVGD